MRAFSALLRQGSSGLRAVQSCRGSLQQVGHEPESLARCVANDLHTTSQLSVDDKAGTNGNDSGHGALRPSPQIWPSFGAESHHATSDALHIDHALLAIFILKFKGAMATCSCWYFDHSSLL